MHNISIVCSIVFVAVYGLFVGIFYTLDFFKTENCKTNEKEVDWGKILGYAVFPALGCAIITCLVCKLMKKNEGRSLSSASFPGGHMNPQQGSYSSHACGCGSGSKSVMGFNGNGMNGEGDGGMGGGMNGMMGNGGMGGGMGGGMNGMMGNGGMGNGGMGGGMGNSGMNGRMGGGMNDRMNGGMGNSFGMSGSEDGESGINAEISRNTARNAGSSSSFGCGMSKSAMKYPSTSEYNFDNSDEEF
jgi:hypothetical protein